MQEEADPTVEYLYTKDCYIPLLETYIIIYIIIWECIWKKGPIGNVFTILITEKLPFQMLQAILKYS